MIIITGSRLVHFGKIADIIASNQPKPHGNPGLHAARSAAGVPGNPARFKKRTFLAWDAKRQLFSARQNSLSRFGKSAKAREKGLWNYLPAEMFSR